MKQRFYLYKRGDRYYMQDARTGKQQALGTTDKGTALRLLEVKRQSVADPAHNQFILKSCLTTQDRFYRSAPGRRSWTRFKPTAKTPAATATPAR